MGVAGGKGVDDQFESGASAVQEAVGLEILVGQLDLRQTGLQRRPAGLLLPVQNLFGGNALVHVGIGLVRLAPVGQLDDLVVRALLLPEGIALGSLLMALTLAEDRTQAQHEECGNRKQ